MTCRQPQNTQTRNKDTNRVVRVTSQQRRIEGDYRNCRCYVPPLLLYPPVEM